MKFSAFSRPAFYPPCELAELKTCFDIEADKDIEGVASTQHIWFNFSENSCKQVQCEQEEATPAATGGVVQSPVQ